MHSKYKQSKQHGHRPVRTDAVCKSVLQGHHTNQGLDSSPALTGFSILF